MRYAGSSAPGVRRPGAVATSSARAELRAQRLRLAQIDVRSASSRRGRPGMQKHANAARQAVRHRYFDGAQHGDVGPPAFARRARRYLADEVARHREQRAHDMRGGYVVARFQLGQQFMCSRTNESRLICGYRDGSADGNQRSLRHSR
jgi:hypothetical protein